MNRMALGLAMVLLLVRPAATAEVDVKTAVTEVTVFTCNSARVARQGKVQLAPGVSVLRTDALPAAVDLTSIQTSVLGAPGVRIESVETRSELAADKALDGRRAEQQAALETQEDKVFALEQAWHGLQDEEQTRKETLVFLEQMRRQTGKTVTSEMETQRINAQAWDQAIGLLQERADAVRKELREIVARRRSLQKEFDREREALSELRRAMPQDRYVSYVLVTVSSPAAAEAALQLRYNVAGASWEPVYRAQADLDGRRVMLEMAGVVRQSTGEDWTGTTLHLSTARPELGTDVPELRPWYLRAAPAIRNGYTSTRAEVDAPLAQMPLPTASPPPESASASSSITSAAATLFTALSKATIPADGQRHRIPVASLDSAMEIEYVAVPKVLAHAFRRGTLQNAAAYPLLPGAVEVLSGDNYLGRGMLPFTAPGEKLTLGLGVEESVKIELRLLEDKVERKRRGDRVTTTNVFLVTARSFAKKPIALTVIDQIPVAADGDIKVTYGSEARRALRGAEFPGQLQWLLTLAPGATQEVEFDFAIDYSESMRQNLMDFNREQEATRNRILDNGVAAPAKQYEATDEVMKINSSLAW